MTRRGAKGVRGPGPLVSVPNVSDEGTQTDNISGVHSLDLRDNSY